MDMCISSALVLLQGNEEETEEADEGNSHLLLLLFYSSCSTRPDVHRIWWRQLCEMCWNLVLCVGGNHNRDI